MGTRRVAIAATVCLLAACHGPPLLSRVQPKPAPLPPSAPLPASLRVPFLDAVGDTEGRAADDLVVHAAKILRRRAEALRPPPPSRDLGGAAARWQPTRAGRDEAGCLPLDPLRVLGLLRKLFK